jgi:nucleotide-binding universal stress UspA family protein
MQLKCFGFISGKDSLGFLLCTSAWEQYMYRKILVAYNGSPESRSALHACIQLNPAASAEIHLLVVMQSATYLAMGEHVPEAVLMAEMRRMEQELAVGHALMATAGLKVIDHLEAGEPIDVITELVETLGIELLIVGHSRHKPWATRWWRGSVDSLLVEKIRSNILVAADPR